MDAVAGKQAVPKPTGGEISQFLGHSPNDGLEILGPHAATQVGGTIGVTYYDFRNDTPCPSVGGIVDCTGVPLSTDYFLVHCHTVSASCTSPGDWDEVRITPTSFDMRLAPQARGFFVGDYEALGVAGNDFKGGVRPGRRDARAQRGVRLDRRSVAFRPRGVLAEPATTGSARCGSA